MCAYGTPIRSQLSAGVWMHMRVHVWVWCYGVGLKRLEYRRFVFLRDGEIDRY